MHTAVEALEVREEKCLGQLPGAIGAEVEKENNIAVAHALLVRRGKDQCREEFVCFSARILLRDGGGE